MSDLVMDRALDTVQDAMLGDVLEIELEEVKVEDDISRIISSNGVYAPHVYPNGATENITENGFYTEFKFSENGNLPPFDISKISYEDIITEDDEPVDNFPSEKQQRLLVSPLYSSSHLERPMIAAANVGIFHHPLVTPIVPDMFLSLGVSVSAGDEHWDKENRTYYVWKMGKAPEVALEIVSNNKGGEGDRKFERYALPEVKYYVILDHHLATQNEILTVYELTNGQYVARDDYDLPDVNLSLDFWEGTFEDAQWPWIRWCDLKGNLIPTAEENAERAEVKAEQAEIKAEQAEIKVEQAEIKIEQAEAKVEQAEVKAEQAEAKVEQAEVKAEQAEAKIEQAEAEAERERQEKMEAIERAEKAEAEAARQVERILEQARAAGIQIDI